MNYIPKWERLSDAVERVSTTVRMSKTEAQTAIARAIADGVIDLRAKLGRHTKSGMTYVKRVVEGKDFQIATEMNSEDLDWENSRPTNSSYVKRGNADLPHGDWTLKWIELSRSDVTTVLCPAQNTGPPRPTSAKKVAKSQRQSRFGKRAARN